MSTVISVSVILLVPSSEGAIPGPLLAFIGICAGLAVIVLGLIAVALTSPSPESKDSKKEGAK